MSAMSSLSLDASFKIKDEPLEFEDDYPSSKRARLLDVDDYAHDHFAPTFMSIDTDSSPSALLSDSGSHTSLSDEDHPIHSRLSDHGGLESDGNTLGHCYLLTSLNPPLTAPAERHPGLPWEEVVKTVLGDEDVAPPPAAKKAKAVAVASSNAPAPKRPIPSVRRQRVEPEQKIPILQEIKSCNWDQIRRCWEESSASVSILREFAKAARLDISAIASQMQPAQSTDESQGPWPLGDPSPLAQSSIDVRSTFSILQRIPDCFYPLGPNGLFAYVPKGDRYSTPKLFQRAAGFRSSGGQRHLNFVCISVNVGLHPCRWLTISAKFKDQVNNLENPLRNGWEALHNRLQQEGVDAVEFNQMPGDLVYIAPGTLYFTEALGTTAELTWLLAPCSAQQLRMAWDAYNACFTKVTPPVELELDRLTTQKEQPMLPLQRLTYNLAQHACSLTDVDLQGNLAACVAALVHRDMEALKLLTESAVQVTIKPLDDRQTSANCSVCKCEIFNTCLVDDKGLVLCCFCANPETLLKCHAYRARNTKALQGTLQRVVALTKQIKQEKDTGASELRGDGLEDPCMPSSTFLSSIVNDDIQAQLEELLVPDSPPFVPYTFDALHEDRMGGLSDAALGRGHDSPALPDGYMKAEDDMGPDSDPASRKQRACKICGKVFNQPGNLSRHYIVHSQTRPYHCNICGKGFTQKSHVKTHQTVHTGEKPYQCHSCYKRRDLTAAQKFSQLGHLKSHLRMHVRAGELTHESASARKALKCGACGIEFWLRADVVSHQMRVAQCAGASTMQVFPDEQRPRSATRMGSDSSELGKADSIKMEDAETPIDPGVDAAGDEGGKLPA